MMGDPSKVGSPSKDLTSRTTAGNPVAVAGILLLTLATLLIVFVPLVECPVCEGTGVTPPPSSLSAAVRPFAALFGPCERCDGSGKTTLLGKWRFRRWNAFGAWSANRLPTEDEWEKAAGGTEVGKYSELIKSSL